MSRHIGLCIVVDVSTQFPSIITYTFTTYELALAQAVELQKSVDLTHMSQQSTVSPSDGRRATTFLYPDHAQIVSVQECELGETVMPVVDVRDVTVHKIPTRH